MILCISPVINSFEIRAVYYNVSVIFFKCWLNHIRIIMEIIQIGHRLTLKKKTKKNNKHHKNNKHMFIIEINFNHLVTIFCLNENIGNLFSRVYEYQTIQLIKIK